MESEPKSVACQFCQQPVAFPPTFDDTLKCACGAKYHYEFGTDIYLVVFYAEEDGREWKDVFVGVATDWDEETGLSFRINFDVEEKNLFPHEDKIYLFFTKERAGQ